MSSSYDFTVRLWNLESGDQVKLLTGHEDQVGNQESQKKTKKIEFNSKIC